MDVGGLEPLDVGGLEPLDLTDHNANRYPILPGPVISVAGAVGGTATCAETAPAR